MKHIGTYGERRVEIRPHPHDQTGTCWIVEVDGVRLYAESFATAWADADEAKKAAEREVGVGLEWREEA